MILTGAGVIELVASYLIRRGVAAEFLLAFLSSSLMVFSADLAHRLAVMWFCVLVVAAFVAEVRFRLRADVLSVT